MCKPLHSARKGKVSPEATIDNILGPAIDGELPVQNSGPDGGTARRGAQYVGDPARGKDGLLWETALPCGGRNERCDVHGRRAEASMVGRPNGGGLTCMVRCGTVSAI